jgi:hypothetical protein
MTVHHFTNTTKLLSSNFNVRRNVADIRHFTLFAVLSDKPKSPEIGVQNVL